MTKTILDIDDLTVQYMTNEGSLTAVSNASFSINEGEYFGVVGESGCGKSTIAKSIIGGLEDNAEIISGHIYYKGEDLVGMSERELNEQIRWSEISYIPQASLNSLDPLQRIKTQAWKIAETHSNMGKSQAISRFRDLFSVVGLDPDRVNDYPHQFSGGMAQRAIIALALFLNPELVIADEPTTALDVIMQDQIFKYLDDISDSTSTSMMLITHDISLVFESCVKMAIMHSGQVAETGSIKNIYSNPRHPYSILLQEAFPDVRDPQRELQVIEGYPPETFGQVDYCTFVERCPWAIEECHKIEPPLEDIDTSEGSHRVSCIRHDDIKHESGNIPSENTSHD